jgi:hypothetical protein
LWTGVEYGNLRITFVGSLCQVTSTCKYSKLKRLGLILMGMTIYKRNACIQNDEGV